VCELAYLVNLGLRYRPRTDGLVASEQHRLAAVLNAAGG
jgi:hypothetical protein